MNQGILNFEAVRQLIKRHRRRACKPPQSAKQPAMKMKYFIHIEFAKDLPRYWSADHSVNAYSEPQAKLRLRRMINKELGRTLDFPVALTVRRVIPIPQ